MYVIVVQVCIDRYTARINRVSHFCFWVVDADEYICTSRQWLLEQEPLSVHKPLPLEKKK